MTDMKNEMDSDLDQNYSLNSNADPKNMQELTIYVSIEFRIEAIKRQYWARKGKRSLLHIKCDNFFLTNYRLWWFEEMNFIILPSSWLSCS